jgi:hypothetical protein
MNTDLTGENGAGREDMRQKYGGRKIGNTDSGKKMRAKR